MDTTKVKEILINSNKLLGKGSTDLSLNKLEIPIKFTAKPHSSLSSQESLDLVSVKTHPFLLNSNVQIGYSYCYGLTQLLVNLQGPTEAKFASK